MKKEPTPAAPTKPPAPVSKAPSAAKSISAPELPAPIHRAPLTPPAPQVPVKVPLPITPEQEEQIRRGEVTFGVPVKKVDLEPTVRKIAEDRRNNLTADINTEEVKQATRERELVEFRDKLDKMKAELAEIDAFLARN